MKISLWQQFSSNHSGTYTLVGVFKTPTEAQTARDILLKIMRNIDAWYRENRLQEWRSYTLEKEYERTYGIEWQEPIDWIAPYIDSSLPPVRRQLDEHLVLFEQMIFIDSASCLTWQTGHQFTDLMKALGADTYANIYMGYTPDDEIVFKTMNFRLSCTAPTEAIAEDIYKTMQAHLQRQPQGGFLDWSQAVPWEIYHPRFQTLTQVITQEQIAAIYEAVGLWHELNAQAIGNSVEQGNQQNLLEQHPMFSIIRLIRQETVLISGTLTREGLDIIFENAEVRDLMPVIPALGAWMQANGCVVSCQFKQEE